MKIKKILSAFKSKVFNRDQKLVSVNLCDIELKTISGTIRKTTDQDDAWFYYLCKHHDTVFDIGCNIGYTALLALIQNPDRNYLLVDPNPIALNNAHLNLVSNNLGNKANYFAGFVGNKQDDKIKFYTLGSGAAGSMYASHAESAALVNSYNEVNTVTLDYLYNYYNLKPDLVKIDVEGAELLVMEAASKLTKETQCTFFIEMHSVENLSMEQAGDSLLAWCLNHNYKAWYLKDAIEMTKGALIKNRGKCHFLLMPQNESYPDYLKDIPQNAPLPKSLI